jgi:hypothetical protein
VLCKTSKSFKAHYYEVILREHKKEDDNASGSTHPAKQRKKYAGSKTLPASIKEKEHWPEVS